MSQVKVILQEDVPNLGEAGELVSVKPGYARNYLLREKKALPATDARVKQLEHHRQVIAAKTARALKDLRGEKAKVEAVELEVSARVGEEGKLFGSVTSANVAELFAEKGVEIDRRKITMEPVKAVGEYEVEVRLHRDVVAKVKLNVKAAE
jgi:large subunit ribosomal protein L9